MLLVQFLCHRPVEQGKKAIFSLSYCLLWSILIYPHCLIPEVKQGGILCNCVFQFSKITSSDCVLTFSRQKWFLFTFHHVYIVALCIYQYGDLTSQVPSALDLFSFIYLNVCIQLKINA